MYLIKPIRKFVDAYDPTREAIVYAIEATIPALIATAVFLYFRKPLSSIFLYMPSYCIVLTFFYPTYRGKITVMLVTFFLSGLGIFAVNILHKHIYTMMLVLLPILLFIFGSIKYKYAAALAPTLIAIAIALPPGWYQGTIRWIEIGLSFLICIVCLITYELLFTKYRVRSHLRYISSLINDLFFLYTDEDKSVAYKQIRHKHLFKKHSLYRTDIVGTKVFSDDYERFAYKVNLAINKAMPVIMYEDYIFARSKFFVYGFRDILTQYRRFFRNISFMMDYKLNIRKLTSHVPMTPELIENLRKRLNAQNTALILRQTPDKMIRDGELIEKWRSNFQLFCSAPSPDSERAEIEYLLGLNYILIDMDAIRKKLRKIRYGA